MAHTPDDQAFLSQLQAEHPEQAALIHRFTRQHGLPLPDTVASSAARHTVSDMAVPVSAIPEGAELMAAVIDHRHALELTQAEFAARLGISLRTLQEWEQGRRHPTGPAQALLGYVLRHPPA
ncbi:MAG: helix-turn-helix domain-containing protein [Pseudomonadota bacterium]